MATFKLRKNFTLSVDLDDKRVRLLVFKNEMEYVCRKESIKKLEHFITSDEEHIFKGRLQLFKRAEGAISVEAKGETAGLISSADFQKCLQKLKATSAN